MVFAMSALLLAELPFVRSCMLSARSVGSLNIVRKEL